MKSITKEMLHEMLISGKKVHLIDVRTDEEFNLNHIPQAVNIPIEAIENGHFSKDQTSIYITICGKGGGRSEKASQILRDHFQLESYFLDGGTFGWQFTSFD
ncbi:MAG: rhodanese-like domain-containing protein [Flavobacteriia bacterium]|nr:rhodanese-like domain-containing protein [Flavobacteriia bacterium]